MITDIILCRNSMPQISEKWKGKGAYRKRICIGKNAAGDIILYLSRVPITLLEAQKIMMNYGCVDAVAYDNIFRGDE